MKMSLITSPEEDGLALCTWHCYVWHIWGRRQNTVPVTEKALCNAVNRDTIEAAYWEHETHRKAGGQLGTRSRLMKSYLHGRKVLMTESSPLFSPRLAALQRTLTGGDKAALELFWQEIEAEGTPLIETISGDDSHILATFLYRASFAANPVEIVCALAGRGLIHEPMICLLGTSLWYKTYRVSPGLRTEYWFVANGVAHPDRLNSRLLLFPPDEDALFDLDTAESWFEIPPAEVDSWLEARGPGVLSGQVERTRLKSQVLGNERP